MVRLVKIVIGLLLLLNLFLLTLFVLPVRVALLSMNYGAEASFEYVSLDHMSNDLKKVFWQVYGEEFFAPQEISLKNIIAILWQPSYLEDLGRPFNHARSHVTHQLLQYGHHDHLWQKLQGTVLLIKVHKLMDSEKIFELYLNMLPLGETLFGVETASHQYFNLDSAHLEKNEAAFLAALSQFGHRYNPWIDAGRVQEIQQAILAEIK